MKITRIEPILFDAGIPWESIWCFVRVETDEGISGIGESTTSDPYMAAAVVKRLAEIAIGQNPHNIQQLWQQIYTHYHNIRGGNLLLAALSGIEQALWDIKGKVAGLAVYELLGGKVRDRVPVYLNHMFFAGVDSETEPEAYAERAAEAVARGYRALKITPYGSLHGHASPAELRRVSNLVRNVRKAIGPEVELAVDSHARFAVASAIQAARALEEFDLLFFEEPVPPENVAAMREVRQAVSVPIAAGERVYTKWGFRELLEAQAVAFIQPDIAHCGGIFEGRMIAALAECHYVQVLPHNFYGPVSLVASLHVGACSPNVLMQERPLPVQASLQQQELLTPPLQFVEGCLLVPDGPGLGITFNEDVLAAHRLPLA